MNDTLIWRAQSTIYRDSVDLLGVIDYGDKIAVALPVNFTLSKRERHEAVDSPTLALTPKSAQSLFQALWDAGLRPADGRGSDAQVGALRDHVKFAEEVTRVLLGTSVGRPASRGDGA